MKPLSRLESLIATIVERPAWLLSPHRLHPLELTTALTRALEERAVRLVDRVIAPDEYELLLHPTDLAALAETRPVLETELADYVARTVAERDLSCNRAPAVRILADPAGVAGTARTVARFSPSVAPDVTVAAGGPAAVRPQRTARMSGRVVPFRPSQWLHGGSAAARVAGGSRLELLGPGGVAHTYPLTGDRIVIGRRMGIAISLLDAKVSREHATVEPRDGGYAIRDLGSLNGTLVNGVAIQGVRQLRDGDLVQVGHFSLRYADGKRRA